MSDDLMEDEEAQAIAELPQVFKYHAFCCATERPPMHPRGSCGARGAKPLWEHMAKRMEAIAQPRIKMTASGCMGFCQAGPLMVVYPQGIWYAPKTEEDVDEIIDSHLLNDKPVVRLIIVPQV